MPQKQPSTLLTGIVNKFSNILLAFSLVPVQLHSLHETQNVFELVFWLSFMSTSHWYPKEDYTSGPSCNYISKEGKKTQSGKGYLLALAWII